MNRLLTWLWTHRAKVWLLGLAVVVVLASNLGADGRASYVEPWEYKSLWFRVNAGDDANDLQQEFTAVLNREAAAGWEYVGQCAHTNSSTSWIDFVVFRRPRR